MMDIAAHTGLMSASSVLLRSPGASTTSTRSIHRTRCASINEPYLDQLAHLIADHGIGAFESDIARLVVRLRVDGHGGPLLTVLADKQAAPVARERALGQLLSQLEPVQTSSAAPDRIADTAA